MKKFIVVFFCIALETSFATITASEWEGVIGGDEIGYVNTMSDLSNITGIILIMPGENKTTDGDYTLQWDATLSELTWDNGTAVMINMSTDASYQLYDSMGDYIYAVTHVDLLSETDKSDAVTIETIAATNGFGLGGHVHSIIDLKIFNGYLYAGLEGFPNANRVNLYRSIDGLTWTKIFDDTLWDVSYGADHADDLIVFKDYLYLTMGGFNVETEGGMEVWRSQDGLLWENVVSNGFSLGDTGNGNGTPTIVFNGSLYVATINFYDGVQIWRTDDGITWTQSGENGLGYGTNVIFIEELLLYGPYLYAFDYVWSDDMEDFGRVWRTRDGVTWKMVKEFDFRQNMVEVIEYKGEMYGLFADRILNNWQIYKSKNGIKWKIVSNDIDIPLTTRISELYIYNHELYMISSSEGLVWHSADAISWNQINTIDFGDPTNTALWSILAFQDHLYVGFFNNELGLELWRVPLFGSALGQ